MGKTPQPVLTAAHEAKRLADAICNECIADQDVVTARLHYDALCQLTGQNPDCPDIRRRLVRGALSFTSFHARSGDVAAIVAVKTFLDQLGDLCPDDPVLRHGRSELAVRLSLCFTDRGDHAAADDAFDFIDDMVCRNPGDTRLITTLAKALANFIAIRAKDGDHDGVIALHQRLVALADNPNNPAETLLYRAHGTFNLLTSLAMRRETDTCLVVFADLARFIDAGPPAPVLMAALADTAFALVTLLGEQGNLDAARYIYDSLLTRIINWPEEPMVREKFASAAFNLLTDYCLNGTFSEARHVYDDLLALSITHGADKTVALMQARAGINMMISCEDAGLTTQINLITQDLAALVAANPDDDELLGIVAGIEDAEGHHA